MWNKYALICIYFSFWACCFNNTLYFVFLDLFNLITSIIFGLYTVSRVNNDGGCRCVSVSVFRLFLLPSLYKHRIVMTNTKGTRKAPASFPQSKITPCHYNEDQDNIVQSSSTCKTQETCLNYSLICICVPSVFEITKKRMKLLNASTVLNKWSEVKLIQFSQY